MAKKLEKAIKENFSKLLEERPIKQISVKDISEACGINRNSFYYCYPDIPTLVTEIIIEKTDEIIKQHPGISSLETLIDAETEYIVNHKKSVLHIYKSTERSVFEVYMMKVFVHCVSVFVDEGEFSKEIADDDKELIKNFLAAAVFGIASDWLSKDMEYDLQEKYKALIQFFRSPLNKDIIFKLLC